VGRWFQDNLTKEDEGNRLMTCLDNQDFRRCEMRELTAIELERQDYVDNQIYNLIVAVAPKDTLVSWDIEMIGAVRDKLKA
jgi:hypothetical protein